jgi:hypothetical protein
MKIDRATLLNIDCMEKKTSPLKGRKRKPESVAKTAAGLRKGAFFNCIFCGSEFWRQPSAIIKGQNKFCSRSCYQKNQVGKPKSEAFKNFCKTRVGEKSPSWMGGITKGQVKARNSDEYRIWREAVFVRDFYTCVHCDVKSREGKTVYLHAHHLKSFANFPQYRFDVSNGITLCKECNYKVHTK